MSTVLRIPRTDDPSNEDSCIILKVKQGGKPGDWDLVGTEGQNPYHLAGMLYTAVPSLNYASQS